jgi:cytochrome b561
MMRAVGNSERGVFDQTTRVIHWATAGLMLCAFVLAFSIDLAMSRATHTAFLQLHRSVGLTTPCSWCSRFWEFCRRTLMVIMWTCSSSDN